MDASLPRLQKVALTMAADRITAEVAERFETAGISYAVLKGPIFAEWLFDRPEERFYSDSDFLVRPDDLDDAWRVLEEMGFATFWDVEFPGKRPWVEKTWIRSSDDAHVDVHRNLSGVE
ncbi:MAG TPA: nucleotidyltransferase family protein, partial [Actinomycetota bacterium]|nr:nucleotidyltransferase family protein [Actinomycetota bacterium]